jgi:hypothetical protein
MRENNPSAQRASWGMITALHEGSSYICTIWFACMHPMLMFLAEHGIVPARAPRVPTRSPDPKLNTCFTWERCRLKTPSVSHSETLTAVTASSAFPAGFP